MATLIAASERGWCMGKSDGVYVSFHVGVKKIKLQADVILL